MSLEKKNKSFAYDVREELARAPKKRECCALAEVAAMVLSSSGFTYRGAGKYGLSIHTDSASVASRYLKLCERFLAVRCTLQSVVSAKLGERVRYEIIPPEESVARMVDALGLYDPDAPFGMRFTLPESMIEKPCCKAAFLRGAFLGCGTVGDPMKSYQLEFAFGDEPLAEQAVAVLDGLSIPAKRTIRKTQSVVYIRDGDLMSELLSRLSAFKAVTDLESIRVMKEVRMQINRQVNCDTSNVEKMIDASEQQLAAIHFIDKRLGIDNLEEPLRILAHARRDYPDLSLSDLGEVLNPPLSKSGVNGRMRKLKLIAEELANP